MDEMEFDRKLVAAAFDAIAARGWRRFSVAGAARSADLPLDQARLRFPRKVSVLIRFGRLADAAALAAISGEGGPGSAEVPREMPGEMTVRDRLFEMLMRRFDVLQAHRAGVIALLRHLPTDPPLAALLGCTSLASMGWLLEAAGISASGPLGRLRRKGLLGVWLWAVRAWMRDESVDLPATMAALDTALARAEQAAGWLPGGKRGPLHAPPPAEEPEAPPPTPTVVPPADPPPPASPPT
jgi:hypothetical protein